MWDLKTKNLRKKLEEDVRGKVDISIIWGDQRHFKDKDASVFQKETEKPFALFF